MAKHIFINKYVKIVLVNMSEENIESILHMNYN